MLVDNAQSVADYQPVQGRLSQPNVRLYMYLCLVCNIQNLGRNGS